MRQTEGVSGEGKNSRGQRIVDLRGAKMIPARALGASQDSAFLGWGKDQRRTLQFQVAAEDTGVCYSETEKCLGRVPSF